MEKVDVASEEGKLPIVFDRILQEIEKNGGSISTEDFKKLIYNTRFTEHEIINELYDITIDKEKVKSILNMMRLTKKDAKDIKIWLKVNGYITIEHAFQKETITLEKQ